MPWELVPCVQGESVCKNLASRFQEMEEEVFVQDPSYSMGLPSQRLAATAPTLHHDVTS
jgi:hypothetical protein